MSLFEDNPWKPPDQNLSAQPSSDQPAEPPSAEPLSPLLSGDPISYAAGPLSAKSSFFLPEDLRISWSWPHLLTFVVFVIASQFTIVIAVLAYFSADQHLSQRQLRHLLESDPRLIIGTNVVWFALIILFLYVTLAVLRGLPFWRSLGWKKIKPDPLGGKGQPWMYFLSGCGLAVFVAIASSRVKNADHVPIQELFKNRNGAMLLMAMAVLVAPLVEETVFRGYLYPLFASKFTGIAEHAGVDPLRAIRFGTFVGIFITGILFGLMHGSQLGWTWGLVALLTLVGVIFTFARAWTGTVLASFLLHLGYNSMIAFTTIVFTKGFTHMPPHP